jgi:hypothetical protein
LPNKTSLNFLLNNKNILQKLFCFNNRDFAYVARDKLTKIHMCHVFRSEDVPAKEIANTLRDICKQIMLKKGLIQKAPKQLR